ncbi:MAG TPA: class GN sortase [Thermoanaerobaculia bacterium]|nr:class GN sortase [Thermoanaerobaculia bacterium]
MTGVRRLALLVAAAGLVLAARGAWIPAKAALAQVLLAGAWERAAAGGERPRPWPWADTWPVARLDLPGPGRPLVVLAGASGRTLAFGPGHVDGTAAPGEDGNVVLAGHRDTHFRALAGLSRGDAVELEAPGGGRRRYRVVETAVVDHRDTRALAPSEGARLTLVTCWPFDAVRPGGPLRWVVVAEAEATAGTAAPLRLAAVTSR